MSEALSLTERPRTATEERALTALLSSISTDHLCLIDCEHTITGNISPLLCILVPENEEDPDEEGVSYLYPVARLYPDAQKSIQTWKPTTILTPHVSQESTPSSSTQEPNSLETPPTSMGESS